MDPESHVHPVPCQAESGLRAVAELGSLPDFASVPEGLELVVPVRVYDIAGAEVVHADITIWVTPR